MTAAFQHLPEMVLKIQQTRNVKQAGQLMRHLLQQLGCENFTFTLYGRNFFQTGEIKHELTSQYMQRWQQHFIKNQYELVDPIGKSIKETIVPVLWDLENEYQHARSKAKRMFGEALDYGLATGISMPFYSQTGEHSVLVIHNENIVKFFEKDPSLQFCINQIGQYYHQHILGLLLTVDNHEAVQLTKRELECLVLTSYNKTAAEIAEMLNITVRTVGFHIEHVNNKLGCKNKFQSVVKAIALGLIVP